MSLYIFDLGEVLLLDVDILKASSRHLGIDEDDLVKDYWKYDPALSDGFMSVTDYYRHIEIKYAVNVSIDFFNAFFRPEINTPVLALSDMLRSRGNRCVIGSNTTEPHWREVISGRYSEIKRHFDSLYASYEMHISKPSGAFWRSIMEKEGFRAENTYFIDDRKDNIEGAEELGIRAFRYLKNDEDLKAFLSL